MKRSLRVGLAMAAILGALDLDAWYIRRPGAHSVAEFSPFVCKLGREELIVKNPVTPDRTLLAHQGADKEAVDIFFERGALAKVTRGLLKEFTGANLEAAQTIAYTTLDSGETRGDTCRTFVTVAFEKDG